MVLSRHRTAPARRRCLAALGLAAVLALPAACGQSGSNAGTGTGTRTRASGWSSGDPRAGLSIYRFERCATCHSIADVSVGTNGPALDGEGNRRTVTWLRGWLPAHMRGAHSTPLSRRDREDLVAYLGSVRQ